jgi:hypothetical protein
VVIRQVDLEIYTRPSATRGPVYIKSVRTVEIWEVVALDPLPLASMSPLRLLVISRSGVELITLESDTVLNDVIKCNSSLLAEMPYRKDFPWYHLAANGTGRRVCWFGIQDWLRMQPHLVSMALDPRPSDSRSPLTTWMDEELNNSALWALPSLDFDEALGYTVLGNYFGELAIYDCVPSDPIKCCGLASDLTYHQGLSSPIRLSQVCFRITFLLQLMFPAMQKPISLGLRPLPRLPRKMDPDTLSTWVSDWSDEDLNLDPRLWNTDWVWGSCRSYQWLGAPGDSAWLLNHAFYMPGTISLQAYGSYDSYDPGTCLILRSGNRYLFHCDDSVRSLPMGPFPRSFEDLNLHGQPCMRPTAFTEATVYNRNLWFAERGKG